MRDYYSEEIEQSAPKRDYFTEELIKNKPDRTENILQKAAKAVMTIAQPDVQANSQFPFLPKIGGISQNVYDAGMDITSDKLTDTGHPVAASAVPIISSIVGGIMSGSPLPGLGKGAIPGMAKSSGEIVKKGAGWMAEPWQNASKISKFKSSGIQDIENVASSELAKANKIGSLKKQVVNKLYGDEPSTNLQSNESFLKKGIEKSSDKEALRLQEDLPKLYGKRSNEFGEGLNKLVGDKPIPVKASSIQPQLEKSLLDHGILKFDETGKVVPSRTPIGPKETKIYNMYRNFKEGLFENPDITVDASDLLKSQSSMKVPWGKKFSSEDMLMSRVRSNVSSVLEDSIPGLKEFRSSHAPFLKGKSQSIKELNPFSTEYETGKASGFLKRYAKGESAPDEKRLIGFLEEELGREINSTGKAMGNRLQQSASKNQSIKTKLSEELSRVDRAIEDSKAAIGSRKAQSSKEIEDIVDEMIRKNNLEKWKRKGIGIGAGAILSNTILKQVGKWYSGKPND